MPSMGCIIVVDDDGDDIIFLSDAKKFAQNK